MGSIILNLKLALPVIKDLEDNTETREWLDQILQDEYMNTPEVEFEEVVTIGEDNCKHLLAANTLIRAEIKLALNENNETIAENIWKLLIEEKINPKHLAALISYYVSNINESFDNTFLRNLAILCSNCYILLLSYPGMASQDMVHSILFGKCMDILKTVAKVSLNKNLKQKSTRGRKKKSAEEEVDFENATSDIVEMSPMEIKQYVLYINRFMNDLLLFLQRFTMKNKNTDILNSTVQNLVDLLFLNYDKEIDFDNNLLLNAESTDISHIGIYAYQCLKAICVPYHGKVGQLIFIVFSSLWSNILRLTIYKDFTPGTLQTVKNNAIRFAIHLVEISDKEGLEAGKILFQNSLTIIPDRFDQANRQKLAKMTIILLRSYPYSLSSELYKWLWLFSISDKPMHRLLALEMASILLEQTELPYETPPTEEVQGKEYVYLRHSHLLLMTLFKCYDRSISVRATAFSIISSLVSRIESNLACKQVLLSVFEKTEVAPIVDYENLKTACNLIEAPLPSGHTIIEFISVMHNDDRATVKRSVINALTNICLMDNRWLTPEMLKILTLHTRDFAMQIRLTTLHGIDNLLNKYNNSPELLSLWLQSMMAGIYDPEQSVIKFAIESCQKLLLETLLEKNFRENLLPWKLYELIPKYDMKNMLLKALKEMNNNKFDFKQCITALERSVNTKDDTEAWMMLSLLAEICDIENPEFAVHILRERFVKSKTLNELAVLHCIIKFLFFSVKNINVNLQQQLSDFLLGKVHNCVIPIEIMNITIDLLAACHIQNPNTGLKTFKKYCADFLKYCEIELSNLLTTSKKELITEDMLIRYITLLANAVRAGKLEIQQNKTNSILHTIMIGPHLDKLDHIQSVALRIVPSDSLRAATIVTLGELALQNETNAHNLVTTFEILLDNDCNAIRTNVLYTLADFCGRYALLVDPLVPKMASCLLSNDVSLQKQALILLVQLLQEDYIKLKHGLFFYFLRLICDPDKTVQEMSKFFITEHVASKKITTKFLLRFFKLSILIFNNHDKCIEFDETNAPEKEIITQLALSGNENAPKRLKIYKFFVDLLTADNKDELTNRIYTDLITRFNDDTFGFDTAGIAVLKDIFNILGCEEMKLTDHQFIRDDEDDENKIETIQKSVKEGLKSHVKKNLVEVVPIIRTLNAKLRAINSPLSDNLMNLLRDIMRDYKTELKALFENDITLQQEVEYDIRELEEAEKKKQRVREQLVAKIGHIVETFQVLAVDE